MRHVLGLALLIVMGFVQAAPVTWYVNATFIPQPGGTVGTLTGSFDFEENENSPSEPIITNVNLTSTCDGSCASYFSTSWETLTAGVGASIDGSFPFIPYTAFFSGNGSACDSATTTCRDLLLYVAQDLRGITEGSYQIYNSNTPGFSKSLLCYNGCNLVDPATYTVQLTGTVTAVPVPAAVWLFMSGLGVLGFARKRRV